MTLPDALLALALLLLPLSWYSAGQLWVLAQENPTLITLRERAFAAVMLAVAASGFVVVVVVGDAIGPDASLIARRGLIVMLTLPAIYWLYTIKRQLRDVDGNPDDPSRQWSEPAEALVAQVDEGGNTMPRPASAPVIEDDL